MICHLVVVDLVAGILENGGEWGERLDRSLAVGGVESSREIQVIRRADEG